MQITGIKTPTQSFNFSSSPDYLNGLEQKKNKKYSQPNFTGANMDIIKSFNQKMYKLTNKINLLEYYRNESARIALQKYNITKEMPLDAFRHGWTSADITYKYGKLIAKILGGLNEYTYPSCEVKYANMDLWNNRVGRNIGKEAKRTNKKVEDLPDLIKEASDDGRLIVDPDLDKRQYKSKTFSAFKYLQKKLGFIT